MNRSKIWVGIGAFVLTGAGTSATVPAAPEVGLDRAADAQAETAPAPRPVHHWVFAQAKPGGEGGEGGEAGIDPEAADRDPVAYGVALEVIAAHYYAGLAAYESGQKEAGAEMFAHGHSEVYAAMADVFEKRGVRTLGEKLEKAVATASGAASVKAVRKDVAAVLAALEEASKSGPASPGDPVATKAKVMAEMLDRAAAQYALAVKGKEYEPYLDGYGFLASARAGGKDVLPWLKKKNAKQAADFQAALALGAKAYPGIKRPRRPAVDPGKFLAAASAVKFDASRLN